MTDRAKGHTLVELLLALCLLAILAAGVLRFLAAGLGAVARAQASLAAQRSLRRATAQLSGELAEMGFFVPCRSLALVRPGFQLAQGRPLQELHGRTLTPPAPGGGGAFGDELTLLKDEVLPGGATLALAPQTGAGPTCTVTVASRGACRIHPGDLLLVEDGRWEAARVLARADLAPGRNVEVPAGALEGTPVFRKEHAPGAPVTFLRPLRVVQYRLVHLRKGRTVPCAPALVRLETSCEAAPGAIDWAALLRGGTDAQASVRVVAEGVHGFRVDLPRGPGAGLPPLVRVTLRAQGPAGPVREASFLCAPRHREGRP